MNRITFLTFAVSLLAQPAALHAADVPKPAKPNIIVILTDDQGYADLSSQRQLSDIKTPNIDALAAQGVRMTAGYVTAPQCSPSRRSDQWTLSAEVRPRHDPR